MRAGAAIVDLPLRCTPDTVEIVTDTEHPVIAGVGAARSMKTQTGCVWYARQWVLRGGLGTISWLLGPELDRAFVLVEKLFIGEGDNPPVFPSELVRRFPASKDSHDQTVELIDGHVAHVKHMGKKGANLTARGVVFAQATEMATVSDEKNFVRLLGRTVQSRGQIYLDAVPESRNWVQHAILDGAIAEQQEIEDAIKAGTKPNPPTYRVVQLSQSLNVWVALEAAAAFMRNLKRIDPRMAAREAGGEWVNDKDLWLPQFDKARHTFDPLGADPLDFLGYEDCTQQASLRWFSTPKTHVIACDINARPHTALMARFGVPKGARPDIPANWNVFLIDILQVYGVDSLEAARELAVYRGGSYKGAGVIIDATSTMERHNAGGVLNQRLNMIPKEAYERAGFETRGPQRQKDGERYCDPAKFDSSLVVRGLFAADRVHIVRGDAQAVIYALTQQQTEDDGVTPEKRASTVQDRKVASVTDVLRYLIWPFFSLTDTQASGAPLHVQVFS